MDPETSPLFSSVQAKVIIGILFILFAILIYFTIFKLLRFDVGNEEFYISNYFKTYKYNFKDVESINTTNFLFINLLKINMRQKSSLGRTFNVLYKKAYWDQFAKNNSQIKPLLK